MNSAKKKAFVEYKNRAHEGVRKVKEGRMSITNNLHPAIRRVRQQIMNITRLMNEVFANTHTRRGVPSNGPAVIYRGLSRVPIRNGGLHNRSFSSWSSRQNIAATFRNGNGVLLRLNTKHLKNIPVVSYKNNVNKSNIEFEYILPPMKFKVMSRNGNYVNVVPNN